MKEDILLLTAVVAALVAGLAVLFLNVSFLLSLGSEEGKVIDGLMKLLFAIAAGVLVLIDADRATGYTDKAR